MLFHAKKYLLFGMKKMVTLSLVYVFQSILVRICRVRPDVARIRRRPPELSLRGSPCGTAISRSEFNKYIAFLRGDWRAGWKGVVVL